MQVVEHLELSADAQALACGLSRLNDLAEKLSSLFELPGTWTYATQLVLEEVFTNIVHYGQVGPADPIIVDVRVEDGFLEVLICDRGISFNPFADTPEPDRTSGVDERPVGGLGVFLVKELVHSYVYERVGSQNKLTLRMAIDS